jgi:hypothetical protein
MTNYTTRVELHQAGAEDYRILIQALKKGSFIADKNNPTSGNLTFRRRANVEIKTVIDTVVKAASSTGKKFSFTVMKDKQTHSSRLCYP